MAEFPAMPLWTDAYLGDTTHLTTIEHGAYLLLLISMWRSRDKNLPDDDKLLARYARLNRQQWARIKPVLERFFDIENGVWTQGRLTDEAAAVKQKSHKQSNRAKARWLKTKKTNDAVAMPGECRSDATLTLTQPSIEKREAKASPKKSPAAILSPLLGEDLAGEVVEHRQRIRKPMTEKAAKLMLLELERCPDPQAGAEMMIARGWQGFKAEWFTNEKAKANGKDKANDKRDRLLQMADRLDRRGEANSEMDRGEGSVPSQPLLPARHGGRGG